MTDWIDALPNEIPLIGDTLPEAPEFDEPEINMGTRYYRLTWFHVPVGWQRGSSMKLPGYMDFDDNTKCAEIKSIQPVHSSNMTLDVFIGSKAHHQTGEEMKFKYRFNNWKRTKDRTNKEGELNNKAGNQFMELAWPALEAMSLADRNKLQNTGQTALRLVKKNGSPEAVTLKEEGTYVYAKLTDEEAGWGKFDPKMKITSVQLFDNEADWLADQEKTFGGGDSQQSDSVDYIDIVPDDWKSSDDLIRDFKKYFLDYHKEGKALENLGLQPSKRLAEVVAGWLEVDAPPPLWPDEVKQYL